MKKAAAALLFVIGLPASPAPPAPGRPGELTPEAERAIDRGLTFLARNQNRDGSYSAANRAAKTGLAVLAFMAAGSTPERGPYAPNIRKGIDFLLECSKRRRGHITDWRTNDWSDVHNHGYGLMALAHAVGEVHDPELDEKIRDAIDLAIRLTIKAQTDRKSTRLNSSH